MDLLRDFLAGLFEIDEHVELIRQDARGIGHRVIRRNRAVGLDRHRQLVIVARIWPSAGVLDLVGDLAHRREQAVDGDQADSARPRDDCARGDIALAGGDREFHANLGALIEGADLQIRIEHG